MQTTALIWGPELAAYGFGEGHPLNPRRLELTVELIRAMGLLDDERATPVVAPRMATDRELLRVHSAEYVDAVKRFSRPDADPDGDPRYGIGTEDVPVIEGMHGMSALVAGATLVAAEEVMSGRAARSLSIAGGLHHAHRARAAGFCVYNDLALAIEWMRREHGARVMYLDYDAHHGDGVQELFYEDPDVLTVSFHESGTYLFPGTGFVDELGRGDGFGRSANVPLDPNTGDDSFAAAFEALLPELAAAFRPDVIVLQNGCDAHALDPLTHLRATTSLTERVLRTTLAVADEHCAGRVVATGGGGYAIHQVVPRAWTLVWAALSGQDAPDALPESWLETVRAEFDGPLIETLRDPEGLVPASPHAKQAREMNERTVRALRSRIMPALSGWGLHF